MIVWQTTLFSLGKLTGHFMPDTVCATDDRFEQGVSEEGAAAIDKNPANILLSWLCTFFGKSMNQFSGRL
jgi:hypothetical protein